MFSVEGQLDTKTCFDLESAILDQINTGARRIVVDCERLVYIYSAGLRALMMAVRKLKPIGGKLRLSSIQDELVNSLKIAGALSLFCVVESLEQAIDELR